MLSYRHAFHAGNHADVLKHFIEVQLLRYLAQKDKPFWFIDTHAGAGCYSLDSGYAAQNAEYESGIARLWGREDLPAPLAEYVALVKRINPDGQLKLYPGSPLVAVESLRGQDRMRLFELHPADSEILRENFAAHGSKVLIQAADGLGGLKALLPPPPRRALVLIDPSYEDKQDYQRVVSALREGLKRFAGGMYAVWYPQLQRAEAAAVARATQAFAGEKLAQCCTQRAKARRRWFRHVWQRDVHHQSAVVVAWRAAAGDALFGQGAGARRRGRIRAGV